MSLVRWVGVVSLVGVMVQFLSLHAMVRRARAEPLWLTLYTIDPWYRWFWRMLMVPTYLIYQIVRCNTKHPWHRTNDSFTQWCDRSSSLNYVFGLQLTLGFWNFILATCLLWYVYHP